MDYDVGGTMQKFVEY